MKIVCLIVGLMTLLCLSTNVLKERASTRVIAMNEMSSIDNIPMFEQRDCTMQWKGTDQYGKVHTIGMGGKQAYVLLFWNSSCPDCLTSLKMYNKIYDALGNDSKIIFYGIISPASHSKDQIIHYLQEEAITMPVLFDLDQDLIQKAKLTLYPTTYLLDGQGKCIGYREGSLSKMELNWILTEVEKEKN